MKYSKIVKRVALPVLLIICVLGVRPWRLLAQADAGYTKLGNTAALTFTDATVVDGNAYQYEVTAFNGLLESTALKSNGVIIPATGAHSTATSWGASTTSGVTYNVYRTTVTAPNPPGAVSTTVN